VSNKNKEKKMSQVTIKIHKPEYVLSTLKTVNFKATSEDGAKGEIEMFFETGEYYEDDADFPGAPRYKEGAMTCYDYGYYWEIGDIVKKWKDKIMEAA
jgi:hypothetical protein